MSMQSNPSSNNPSAGQQRRQATSLLLRLQWLVILILLASIVWLYVSQQRFERQMDNRLQSNEQVIGRLNDMDDRLFAISQASAPAPSVAPSSQAQNQLALLRIQIKTVDKLLLDNDYDAAIELLRGLQWQLSQSSNEIAPALTIVLRQSLVKDIERLQAKASQSSPWALQNLAIQNIQNYLHTQRRLIGRTDANNLSAPITARDMTISEIIMTLNLAMQSSNMHNKDQLVSYLSQAQSQLRPLLVSTNANSTDMPRQTAQSDVGASTAKSSTERLSNLSALPAPKRLADVSQSLETLIAAAPTTTALLTSQVLADPKR
ncbi:MULTISPECIES: hypothetical protein [unclassified Psychrobacter]|uniref:hypothetical protein n=1 Tax=unclassified Psychrobacter TaxID=196806 RepID=UPI0018F409F9|nr:MULTISPECIES: hypothetical protein [unclassified Psychrobacter]